MGRITIVLGAGASRGVSYAHKGQILSPLDSDFFDLLRRHEPAKSDKPAVDFVLERYSNIVDRDLWRSMERAFFTLHLRTYLREKLLEDPKAQHDAEELVQNFARSIQSLLRAAHDKRICMNHKELLTPLTGNDLIISFNYDLVIERAIRGDAEKRGIGFGGWLYGFEPKTKRKLPLLLKLHGSSNWVIESDDFILRTKNWAGFDGSPGYRGHQGTGTVFPIFLPFWDKRIEKAPWSRLWSQAAENLAGTEFLIVWGYSLSLTDIKSRELFNISIENGGEGIKMCVIDPSTETRTRWRALLPKASYWEYDRIRDFIHYPPTWWVRATERSNGDTKPVPRK